MLLETTHDFKSIVLNKTPLIDVRAPIEFEKGAFIGAVNLPIMDNEQRHLIGIKYKEDGNEQAVSLGHHLVSGENKQSKIKAWTDYINEHPSTMIYCFRGGQRSRISQEWIQEATGNPILRLEGGYKAFRNYLMEALIPENQNYTPIRLGGCTGSGKTILLQKIENKVDLEFIAHHRGSSFGQFIDAQPSQINFENNLAYCLLQQEDKGYKHLIFEDEGRNVGKCFLPKPLAEFYSQSNLVILDVPYEQRVQITLQEYVIDAQNDHVNYFGEEEGLNQWLNYILISLSKASKRLGGTRHQELIGRITTAFKTQLATGSFTSHESWISTLLFDYYDPMYNYQLENAKKFIIYRGNEQDVLSFLKQLEASS